MLSEAELDTLFLKGREQFTLYILHVILWLLIVVLLVDQNTESAQLFCSLLT